MSEYKPKQKNRENSHTAFRPYRLSASSPVRPKKTAPRKISGKRRLKKQTKAVLIGGVLALLAAVGVFSYLSAKDLKNDASRMKSLFLEGVGCITDSDPDGARSMIDEARELDIKLMEKMDTPFWTVVSWVPGFGKTVTSARTLLRLVDETCDDIIYPAINMLEEYPEDQLKAGSGKFNVRIISAWLDFAKEKMPAIKELAEEITGLDLSLVDSDGKIAQFQAKLTNLAAQYDELEDTLDVLSVIIGDGSDRFYIFAAMNSAEMRAAGGFPGSVGSIVISDGILSIGDFRSVYYVMSTYTPASVGVTDQEISLFSWQMGVAHDSEYDPDFRRVAEIWTAAYEERLGVEVDGVVAMTPTIIQKLLSISGEITLSDGTVMNGDNATYQLQYGLYYKYYSSWMSTTAFDIDDLFAETASAAMSEFTEHFSFKKVDEYFNIWDEAVAERILMIWMKDEAEEQIIIDSGCSGVLNAGVNNATAGVYVSIFDPSKLGWWVDIDTAASPGMLNADGSISYDVTVTLNNCITYNEIADAGTYIIGSNSGAIATYVHLFAPVGGTIENVVMSNGQTMYYDEYQGVELAYRLGVYLYRDSPITITYTLTTAPDVDEPLTFAVTPTLQSYRQ